MLVSWRLSALFARNLKSEKFAIEMEWAWKVEFLHKLGFYVAILLSHAKLNCHKIEDYFYEKFEGVTNHALNIFKYILDIFEIYWIKLLQSVIKYWI